MGRLVIGMLLSGTLLAAPAIVLQPGSEITLTPDEAVTVRCEGTSILDSFCVCVDRGIHYMVDLEKHYVFAKGQITKVELGKTSTLSQCESRLKSLPTCQR